MSVSSESNHREEVKRQEVRIIYRSRDGKPAEGFAAPASATPEMYEDPRTADRKKDADKAEKGKTMIADARPNGDPVVKKASAGD